MVLCTSRLKKCCGSWIYLLFIFRYKGTELSVVKKMKPSRTFKSGETLIRNPWQKGRRNFHQLEKNKASKTVMNWKAQLWFPCGVNAHRCSYFVQWKTLEKIWIILIALFRCLYSFILIFVTAFPCTDKALLISKGENDARLEFRTWNV